MRIARFIIVVLLAGYIADFIHINVGIGVPSYNTFIQTMSYLTKPEEALGVAIIYYLVGDRLPAQSHIMKGILLGIIVLLAEGQLIRHFLMNMLLPNTLKEALLHQSQAWLSKMVMSIIIALFIEPKYSQKSINNEN